MCSTIGAGEFLEKNLTFDMLSHCRFPWRSTGMTYPTPYGTWNNSFIRDGSAEPGKRLQLAARSTIINCRLAVVPKRLFHYKSNCSCSKAKNLFQDYSKMCASALRAGTTLESQVKKPKEPVKLVLNQDMEDAIKRLTNSPGLKNDNFSYFCCSL